MFFPFITHFAYLGYVCSGWGERQPQSVIWSISPRPLFGINRLFLCTSWEHSPRAQWWHLRLGTQLLGVLRAEGRENSKEELLWFKKCSCITVSNGLPVRHNARFELMGAPITSRYKCSCVVKSWRCHTAFWTRSSVLQQSSSFSLLSHLQDYIFSILSEPGSWKHSVLFPSTSYQIALAKRNDAWEVRI